MLALREAVGAVRHPCQLPGKLLEVVRLCRGPAEEWRGFTAWARIDGIAAGDDENGLRIDVADRGLQRLLRTTTGSNAAPAGTAAIYSTSTAVPLADTINMPLFWPSTS